MKAIIKTWNWKTGTEVKEIPLPLTEHGRIRQCDIRVLLKELEGETFKKVRVTK